MIRYTLAILVMVVLAVILQQFVPTLTGFFGSRLMLVPLVFLCSAVTVPTPIMLLLAFVCGFLTDAQNTLGPQHGDPEVYPPVEIMRFGYSILLYGAMGYLMQGIQPLFRQGRWQFSAALAGVAVLVYLLAEWLLVNFVRGGFSLGRPTLLMILSTSALTMLFSPPVFWILFRLAELFGYRIRFDGLTKKKRPPTLTA